MLFGSGLGDLLYVLRFTFYETTFHVLRFPWSSLPRLTRHAAGGYTAAMPPPTREVLAIEPLSRPVDAEVQVPGSKSYTNRALIVAAMAAGRSTLTGALFSDDTEYVATCLNALGIRVQADPEACRFDVQGAGGAVPAEEAELFVGNAGTAARFLPALA